MPLADRRRSWMHVAAPALGVAAGALVVMGRGPMEGPGQASLAAATPLARAAVNGEMARPSPDAPVRSLPPRPGEPLAARLMEGGLSSLEARRFVDLMRPYLDGEPPPAGAEVLVEAWPGEAPERVAIALDPDRRLEFRLSGAVWSVTLDSAEVRLDTAIVNGLVEGGLHLARLAGDVGRLGARERARVPVELAEVFAWQLDPFHDPSPGDAFRIALERHVRSDGSVRDVRVIAAQYRHDGRTLEAYRYRPEGAVEPEHYDGEGLSVGGAFLRAPLDLVRVTSRFARARYHPLLRRYRAHTGVDYGAPSGTVVRATGDGRVARAGWAGDYGLSVELAHAGGIRTRYAHMSGIASGLRPGTEIRQGAPIGAVGATGLATAPHLHYEFLVAGRPVDPGSVELPVLRPVPPTDEERFAAAREGQRHLLERTAWPAPPR